MDAADIFGPIASVMGVPMSLSPLFQIQRVLDRRQSDDVSQLMLVIVRRYRTGVDPARTRV